MLLNAAERSSKTRIEWCSLEEIYLSKHHFSGKGGVESRLGVGSRMSKRSGR